MPQNSLWLWVLWRLNILSRCRFHWHCATTADGTVTLTNIISCIRWQSLLSEMTYYVSTTSLCPTCSLVRSRLQIPATFNDRYYRQQDRRIGSRTTANPDPRSSYDPSSHHQSEGLASSSDNMRIFFRLVDVVRSKQASRASLEQ